MQQVKWKPTSSSLWVGLSLALLTHEAYGEAVFAAADFREIGLGAFQADAQQLERQAVIQCLLEKPCLPLLMGGRSALADEIQQ